MENWSQSQGTTPGGQKIYGYLPTKFDVACQFLYELSQTESQQYLSLSCTVLQDGAERKVQVDLPTTGWDNDPTVVLGPTTAQTTTQQDGTWRALILRTLNVDGEYDLWFRHDERFFLQEIFVPCSLWPMLLADAYSFGLSFTSKLLPLQTITHRPPLQQTLWQPRPSVDGK